MLDIVGVTRRRAALGAARRRSLAAALAVLAALPAAANLRAPRRVPESPSTALAARAEGLVVERERLTFLCGAEACDVTAEYDLSAPAAERVRLEMVLPGPGAVTARTNGDEGPVRVVPAEPLKPEELRGLPEAGPGEPTLHRAAFEAPLRAGPNTIVVRYVQPLGGEEVGHSSRRAGRFVQRFRYELWPLREWTRKDGFRIRLAIGVQRPAPGVWQRWFGHPRSVACLTSDPAAPALEGRLEQKGDRLWLEAELGPAFPDRITCYVGDDDLMPRY